MAWYLNSRQSADFEAQEGAKSEGLQTCLTSFVLWDPFY